MLRGCLSSNGFSLFCSLLSFIFQVASWVLTSPLAQAPVLVRMASSSRTQLSANTHTHTHTHPHRHTHTHMAPTHPLWAIKCMTNSNPNPSGDFVHDVLMLVVVEFIWECLPSAGAVTHPACIQQ